MAGIAKDRNMPISTRVHAAVKAVGDKIEKHGHDVWIPFSFVFLGCFLLDVEDGVVVFGEGMLCLVMGWVEWIVRGKGGRGE